MKIFLVIFWLLIANLGFAQGFKIALLKYSGGGDWYANPTSLPNLVDFCNKNLHTNISKNIAEVAPSSQEIFNYPFVHATGHGNVYFSESDVINLRNYLTSGGFLHFDDNYGTREFVFREMKKVFPDKNIVELPKDFKFFNIKYHFPDGLPKIHEHDNQPPKAYGIFWENRLVFLYTWECDLGDGMEDIDVHNDTKEMHLQALKFEANILMYVLGFN